MRIITFFAFLVIILFPVYAQDTDNFEDDFNSSNVNPTKSKTYGFSIGIQFGFIYGQAFEYVYPLDNDTKGSLLSELIWDMKPVLYYGIKADFGKVNPYVSPGFFSSLSFKAGIPAKTGVMEDRDWMSTENNSLTHFSSHDNITKEMFTADLLLGASFPVKSLFFIKPFFSGSWMRFSFSGKDGSGTYARNKGSAYYPIDDNPKHITYSGEVIRYEQNWLLLATGFSIGTDILFPLTFELFLKISPLTYCSATDEHLTTRMIYKDFTSFGFYYEPEVNVSIFLKQIELSFNFAYRYIGKTKGETYIKKNTDTQYYLSPNKAGAGLSIIDTRLLAIWHF